MHLKGFTTKSLSERADLPEDTIKNIRYGRVHDAKSSTILKLAKALECSTDELLGRGRPDSSEAEMLRIYQKLSESSKQFVLSVLYFEYALTVTYNELSPFKNEIIVFKPTGYLEDGMIYDSSSYVRLDARDYIQKYGADRIHCGLLITNNSLHPAYHENDILLICNRAPRSGDIIVCLHRPTGRLYVRKYFPGSTTVLEPVNNYGSNIYINSPDQTSLEDWHIFGFVVTHIREPNLTYYEEVPVEPETSEINEAI